MLVLPDSFRGTFAVVKMLQDDNNVSKNNPSCGRISNDFPVMSQSSPINRYYNLPVTEDERMEVAKSAEFATKIF